MHITGLASGLDIDSIIEQMMALERRPIANIQVKQQELEAQKNAWRDINSRMRNLADKFRSLKLESTYVGRFAKTSQEGILQATANSAAVEGSYQVNVKQLATAAVRYGEKLDDIDSLLGEGTLTLKDAGGAEIATIQVEDQWTLKDLVKHINEFKVGDGDAAKPLPIKASIVDNRLVLTSKETGAAGKFTANTDLIALGSFQEVAGSGQDAELEINGIEGIFSASNTLKDVIQGVTLDLKEEGKTTVTISQDTQQVVDKLQEFVEQYNSLIDFINDKLQAKSAMDKNSVRGTLSGDTSLIRFQGTLRSMVVSGAGGEGKYNSLAAIGIGTAKFVAGAADYSGKLTLDKAKLEAALKENPVAVKELLYKTTEKEVDGETVTSTGGIFHNLETYVRGFTRAGDGILTEKDKAYDKQIADLKKQAEKMEQRLEMRQERISAQFVALEKALGTMQSQGNWLAAQLTQLNNTFGQPQK